MELLPSTNRFKRYLRAMNAENVKEWKIELTYRADFIRGMLEPLIFVFPYVLFAVALMGGRTSSVLEGLTGVSDGVTYTIIGYIFMGFLNTAVWGMGFALRKEQWYGTLESIFVAPVPRWVYVMGMASHSIAHQSIILFFQVAVVYVLFGLLLNVQGILPVLIFVALMLISLMGLGLMISGLALMFKEGWIISEVFYSLITIVTPIAYPLAVLPPLLQKLSKAMPTTYAITGIRHFLIAENMEFTLWSAYSRLIIIGVCWVVTGLLMFHIVDRKVRREGTLAEY
ncbi:MAG: ABC transporter permease [Theionarchaea archaeon]|nr:ABC transporter permease [Theionarchaea archaeon]